MIKNLQFKKQCDGSFVAKPYGMIVGYSVNLIQGKKYLTYYDRRGYKKIVQTNKPRKIANIHYQNIINQHLVGKNARKINCELLSRYAAS